MPHASIPSDVSQSSQLALKTHELAVTAMTRIEAHEAECNRREEARMRREAQYLRQYESDIGEIKRVLDQLQERLYAMAAGIQSLVRGVGGVLIVGLAGTVAWLLLNGRPWE